MSLPSRLPYDGNMSRVSTELGDVRLPISRASPWSYCPEFAVPLDRIVEPTINPKVPSQ